MKVLEFAEKFGMKVWAGENKLQNDITGVYVCDLLSWVMSHASKGDAWITVHTNLNIAAVALLTEVACVIVPENINVEPETITRAENEGIVILGTDLNSYEICCRAYECGVGK
ncbi:MAG: DRTGG domain-containing protein [Bacillota bacterium]|nr:DRTGG domain-containing protein [Bacillota bacterium]